MLKRAWILPLLGAAVIAGCGPNKDASAPTTPSTTTASTDTTTTGATAPSTTPTSPAAPGTPATTPAQQGSPAGAPTTSGGSAPAKTAAGQPAHRSSANPYDFKAALLLTGNNTDGGWNEAAFKGMGRIETELPNTHSYTMTNVKPSEFAKGFRDLAKQHYNIIFGHGDEFGPAAAKVATEFPKTVFVTTGGDKSGPNLAPIHFATEQGTYLQGMEAALVSKSGKGGFIGGQKLPPVQIAAEAFEKGAKSVNPNFVLESIYINNWDDAALAKAATQTLLNHGCDVFAHNCDAASKGMFDLAGTKNGVFIFGVNQDENGKAKNVLSSTVLAVPKAFFDIAKGVHDGTFKAAPMTLDMKGGDVVLVDNPKLAGIIDTAGKARIAKAQQDIIAGPLKVAAR